MPAPSRHRSRWRHTVLPALAAAGLGTALWLQNGFHTSWPLAFVLLAGIVASVHRPVDDERGLALGSTALPLADLISGAAGTAIIAFIAWGGASVTRSAVFGGRRPTTRRAIELGSLIVLAALAGAAAGRLVGGDATLAAGAGGVTYLGVLVGGDAINDWLVHGRRRRVWLRIATEPFGLAAEALGWAAGSVLVAVTLEQGTGRAMILLGVIALLAGEAARQRFMRRRAERRGAAMERLDAAGRRLAGGDTDSLPFQISREIRQVLDFSWFHFELYGGDSGPSSWRAGPDREVRPGTPQPPDHPPALPGIHRRGDWTVLERELEAAGELLATVRLWVDERQVSDHDVTLFDRLIPQLTALVHRSVLDRQASRDTLTGVSLRRVMDRRLAASFDRACELGGSLSIVMVDLDHFKSVNDTYGHAAGDQALVALSRVLVAHLREGDVCARWGGEEFALLFEGLDGTAALRIAERLRHEVATLEVLYEGQRLPLTLSAGVGAFPEVHCRAPEEVVRLADEALYRAKETGRNRCLLHRGRNRFLDPSGRALGSGEPRKVEAPRLFS